MRMTFVLLFFFFLRIIRDPIFFIIIIIIVGKFSIEGIVVEKKNVNMEKTYPRWPSMGKMCDWQIVGAIASQQLIGNPTNSTNTGSTNPMMLPRFYRHRSSRDSNRDLHRPNLYHTRAANPAYTPRDEREQRSYRSPSLPTPKTKRLWPLPRRQRNRFDGFRCCYFLSSLSMMNNLNFVSCQLRTYIIYKRPQRSHRTANPAVVCSDVKNDDDGVENLHRVTYPNRVEFYMLLLDRDACYR